MIVSGSKCILESTDLLEEFERTSDLLFFAYRACAGVLVGPASQGPVVYHISYRRRA